MYSYAQDGTFQIPQEFYPQRLEQEEAIIAQKLRHYLTAISGKTVINKALNRRCVAKIIALQGAYKEQSLAELQSTLVELRFLIRKRSLQEEYLIPLFAIISELAERTVAMRYFPHQIEGALAMLQGKVVEMDTGQGKSFCATLAVGTAALLGVPSFVITVNEYLAQRDADTFTALYDSLNLTVGFVQEDFDESKKREIYKRSIVYCTNKQIAFDYLRDRMLLKNNYNPVQLQLEPLFRRVARAEKLILPGLGFGIIDEADSILVDEAVTPLKISAPMQDLQRTHFYRQALDIAGQLKNETHFELIHKYHNIRLTDVGKKTLEDIGNKIGGIWTVGYAREELVLQALKAIYFFIRDKNYVVVEGEVQIVDEFTGRIMPDRSWEAGLHQMIELKERCDATGERVTLSSISYQRFFRRFVNAAGMTGTAKEITRELRTVYNLDVYRVLPAQKNLRTINPLRVCETQQEKWDLILQLIAQYREAGKAVLVGTRSVAVSELISKGLTQMGITHQLLNALNDAEEAQIVAQAGQVMHVTVATNMAGRGTDIKLSKEAKERGGLHVIVTEFHESRRIDRQLYGRCARQGDPGNVDVFASLEDEILTNFVNKRLLRPISGFLCRNNVFSRWCAKTLFRYCQRKCEYIQEMRRSTVLKNDKRLARNLAFTGGME